MLKYAVKRLIMLIPTLLAVTLFIFLLLSLTPANPGRIVYGLNATQEDVDAYNEAVGYSGPLLVRYVKYVAGVFTGNFGVSYYTKEPVIKAIVDRWPVTMRLAFLSLGLAILIGVPCGILAAVKHNSFIDRFLTALSIFLASMPSFWFGVMLLLVFVQQLGWFNVVSDSTADLKAYVLPVISLGIPYSGGFMRYTRGAMLDVIRQDYIRTARAKGATEKRVIFKHAFKNASLTIITITGINLGGLLGGAVITERVFTLNGLGQLGLTALQGKDIPQIMACTIVLSTVFILMMLLVDFLYAFIDPRIKARYKVG